MNQPGPSVPNPNRAPRNGKGSGGYARYKANNLKYGTPLPILLPTSPLHPDYIEPPSKFAAAKQDQSKPKSATSRGLSYLLKSYLSGSSTIKPICKGTFDPLTRSVWITTLQDREILFERGFFGKGSLSRSDPSWAIRRAKTLEGERDGNRGLTSEEVTALRRKERKQFKIDRAQAMLNASLAAEAILTGKAAPGSSETVDEQDDSEIQRSGSPAPSVQSNATSAAQSNFRPTPRLNVTTSTNTAFIPSVDDYAHALPSGETRLTPQTFLVRPTRPDQRVGMKKRTPGTPQPAPAGSNPPGTPETPQPAMIKEEPASPLDPIEVEDLEHLQLNLEEAFFLSWAIGCLDVIHPATGQVIQPKDLLRIALELPHPLKVSPSTFGASTIAMRPDNPFLVSYVAYHHYRSLGWVVKTGIKFCVDWLLYKRGMVFSHAEFALMVMPHYAQELPEESKPFMLNNAGPMTWQWLNTVNRVNTQVKKTLILCYVTMHSNEPVTERDLENPVRLLGRYSVREVTIRRFVPARMRD